MTIFLWAVRKTCFLERIRRAPAVPTPACVNDAIDVSRHKFGHFNAGISRTLETPLPQHGPEYMQAVESELLHTGLNTCKQSSELQLIFVRVSCLLRSLCVLFFVRYLPKRSKSTCSPRTCSRVRQKCFTSPLGTMQPADQHKPQGVAFANKFLAVQALLSSFCSEMFGKHLFSPLSRLRSRQKVSCL